MVTVRGWLAVLLSVFAVGTASALGSGFDPGPGAAAGGGVTVGESVSGGTASRLLWTDASGNVSNATPANVDNAIQTSSTLRVDSTSDLRSSVSNGGNAQCGSVGAGSAGALCLNDAQDVYVPSTTGDGYVRIRGTDTGGALVVKRDSNVTTTIYNASNTSLIESSGNMRINAGGTTGASPLYIFGRVASVIASVPTLSSNQNNYSGCPTTGAVNTCLLNVTADVDVTGMLAFGNTATETMHRALCNIGTNTVTLKHQSASSDENNRFAFASGADKTLAAGACVLLIYTPSSTASIRRWRDL